MIHDEIEFTIVDYKPIVLFPRKALTMPIRSRCLYCHKKNKMVNARSNSIDSMDKLGLFCTLRCAAFYGVLSAEYDEKHAEKHEE